MDDNVSASNNVPERRVSEQPSIETRITDLVRFGVVGLFAYWSLKLIAPFAIILIWAGILAVALHPLYARLNKALGGRERLAALLLTLACLAVIIGPLAAIAFNFIDAGHVVLDRLKEGSFTLPTPPESVKEWPLIGERVYEAWARASSNLGETLVQMRSSLVDTGSVVLGKLASVGGDLLQFVVSVIVAGFFFRHGPRLASSVKAFAHRIAADRGVGFVDLAAATVRNVARGVIGVAMLQALLSGLIFSVFGVPAPGMLSFAVLLFCIVQIGPAIVLLPVAIWAWISWEWPAALGLTVLLTPVLIIDNVLKPILVARGLSTPMLIIILGVIGGTLSYGLVGLFLGPIVLSVFYDLIVAWVRLPAPRLNAPRT